MREVYSIRIDKHVSDPVAAVTYPEGSMNEYFTPLELESATKNADYGDWKDTFFTHALSTKVWFKVTDTEGYVQYDISNEPGDGFLVVDLGEYSMNSAYMKNVIGSLILVTVFKSLNPGPNNWLDLVKLLMGGEKS
jgi:hypothetical protein